MLKEEIITQILKYLKKEHPIDRSIQDIAEAIGKSRETVVKYLIALERDGKILFTRDVGRAKMFTIKL